MGFGLQIMQQIGGDIEYNKEFLVRYNEIVVYQKVYFVLYIYIDIRGKKLLKNKKN